MPEGPIIGNPGEWDKFVKEHPVFCEKLKDLYTTTTKVFIRKSTAHNSADHVVFFLGRLCAEDFSEVLLMCGNGYGYGAMRLLRSMYERAVTQAYIAKHPKEADNFLDYFLVTPKKTLDKLKEMHGEQEVEKMLGKKAIDDVEKDFQTVKTKFTRGKGKKKSLQMSWTKKTMEALVDAAGDTYKALYLYCYVRPLLQAHPSASSILDRLKDEGGTITFDVESSKGMIVWPLISAHNLVIQTLGEQNDYFKLSLDAEIKERVADFQACWNH